MEQTLFPRERARAFDLRLQGARAKKAEPTL